MRVMVIIKATPSSEAGTMPSTELLTAMGNYNEELVQAGIMLDGAGLTPSSRGVRVRFAGTDRIVTDGPFTETKELIAGFWIWKVSSMQEAVAWVKKCPNPMMDESEIELRPLFEMEDFGDAMTPELREQEAAVHAQVVGLNAPSFQTTEERTIVGIQRPYTAETRSQIPAQWDDFNLRASQIPQRKGTDYYGVSSNATADCKFDYLCGVEVAAAGKLADGFTAVPLPRGRWAVFQHTQHVAQLGSTIDRIWSRWAPTCGLPINHQAPCVERYTDDFNPQTGLGGMEIWIPLVG